MSKYRKMVSSDRLPNARRSEGASQAQQQATQEKIRRYLEVPTNEECPVNEETDAHRRWLMEIWKKYFLKQGLDPDGIWSGLCEGDRKAIAWTMAFFSDYVEHSTREVIVLGPEEYVAQRAVNSAGTCLAMWRKLVKEADLTVLKAKRQQEPQAGHKWRLRFHGHNPDGRKPASSVATWEISQWIWQALADEYKLSKELTFDKVEATSEDVLVVLRTLWDRAADLGIDPETRIAFHANVLMTAMGGFRPGCLGKLCYKDVVLSILRSPQHPSRVKYAATIAIKRNKQKESLSVRKSDKIKFSVFFVPCPLVCLARLVVSRAIQDNAFDPGFADAQEFLTRPALGKVDYIDLKWKDEVLTSPVFKLSYVRFLTIWHRVCRVAGFRTEPRLYAMRVGAGARLDAHPLFSDALRNYIMSHTNSMFETQYQTSRIREDLAQAAFGPRAGSGNAPLFALLRNISLSKDTNAPIDVARNELAEFEARKDATTLRAAMVQARDEQDFDRYDTLNSRLKYRRLVWKSLKLADNRRKYFELADRSRALGQQPPRGEMKITNHAAGLRVRASNAPMASQVSQYLERQWNTSDDDGNPARYIDLLVAYLCKSSKVKLHVWEEEDDGDMERKEEESDDDEDDDEDNEEDDDKSFQCLICDIALSSRGTLTGHYSIHIRDKTFEGPFRCPECRRNKIETLIVTGFAGWVNHLEGVHGERYTPYFQQTQTYVEVYPCPLPNCNVGMKGKRFNSNGLVRHFSRGHVNEMDPKRKKAFRVALPCPRCRFQGAEKSAVPEIKSITEWKHHFDSVHSSEKRTVFECYICLEEVRTASGLKMHFLNSHQKKEEFFKKPFLCPECVRAGNTNTPKIMGREAWQEHIKDRHNGAAKEKLFDTFVRAPETVPHFPCLICLKCYGSSALLRNHLAVAHAEQFKERFQCPACVRNSDGYGESFIAKSTWLLHVAREHMGYRTGSTTCPGHAAPNAKRKFTFGNVNGLELSLDPTVRLPTSLQQCGSSRVSATSDSDTSGLYDLPSEEITAGSSPLPDLDDMVIADLENTQSLVRDLRDRKRKRNMTEEEIPIDPYLLQLDSTA